MMGIKPTKTLAAGKTYADALDSIEEGVIEYMANSRKIDEKAMRDLLDKDAEVRASYGRKIERSIKAGIENGMHPSCFGRAA